MKDGRGGVEGCSNVGSCCIAPTSPGVSRLPRKKVAAGAEELIWQPGSSMANPPGQLDYLHSLKMMPALLGVSCFRQQPAFLKRNIEPSKSSNAMEHVGSSPIDKLILSKKTKSIDIEGKGLFTDLPT